MTKEEKWMKDYEAFYEKHPDCPVAEPIESLTLVMKREYAEAIKNGTKTVEFRNKSKFYEIRIFDKSVEEYIARHHDDPEIMNAVAEGIVNRIRIVRSLHFHNYNNSWEMDVECIENGIVAVCNEDVKFLQKKFNCHELDRDAAYYNNSSRPPLLFYFACGKIENAKNI